MEINSAHMVLTVLCIAKKTILMNWKAKNNLCINQFIIFAFWGYSSSLNTVAAGPEPGGHQALLPCGGSQETGVPIAASLSVFCGV